MINTSQYPNSLMNRLSIDPEKLTYSIQFEAEDDYHNFLSDAYYQAGEIIFYLDIDQTLSYQFKDKAHELLSDKLLASKFNRENDDEVDLTVTMTYHRQQQVIFDWFTFVHEELLTAKDDETEFDISGYLDIIDLRFDSIMLNVKIESANYEEIAFVDFNDANELLSHDAIYTLQEMTTHNDDKTLYKFVREIK